MESRIANSPVADEVQEKTTEKVVNELKAMIQRAEEKAVESAKAADRVVRDYPYQSLGVAFGLGVLVGFLVRRK
ncbi:MAG TPA: hypothetical protein VKY92_06170 [Verrucomicrobiae bacterium]|nr:hypothetical protein [Verrucomicrobiae bacterium]